MSYKMSDETTAAGMAVGFFGVAAVFLFAIAAAVATFVCIPLTIVAYFAWDDDIYIIGKRFTSKWAQGFMYRGVAGAVVTPLFLAFCIVFFSPWMDPVDWAAIWWPQLVLGGYVAGSVGGDVIIWSKEREKREQEEMHGVFTPIVQPQAKPAEPPPVQDPFIYRAPQPFEFASWDDEERMS